MKILLLGLYEGGRLRPVQADALGLLLSDQDGPLTTTETLTGCMRNRKAWKRIIHDLLLHGLDGLSPLRMLEAELPAERRRAQEGDAAADARDPGIDRGYA